MLPRKFASRLQIVRTGNFGCQRQKAAYATASPSRQAGSATALKQETASSSYIHPFRHHASSSSPGATSFRSGSPSLASSSTLRSRTRHPYRHNPITDPASASPSITLDLTNHTELSSLYDTGPVPPLPLESLEPYSSNAPPPLLDADPSLPSESWPSDQPQAIDSDPAQLVSPSLASPASLSSSTIYTSSAPEKLEHETSSIISDLKTQEPEMKALDKPTSPEAELLGETETLLASSPPPSSDFVNIADPTSELHESEAQAGPAPTSSEKLMPYVEAEGEVLLTAEQRKVLDFVREGNNCFFTGAAGTGKSVLLRAMVRALNQDHGRSDQDSFVGVTASTATAAANLAVEPRAHTLHSWSGWTPYLQLDVKRRWVKAMQKSRPQVYERWRTTKVLIIDEVSMLDGRLIDNISLMGQDIRHGLPGSDQPFGGIQVVFTGDFYQLPPVEKDRSEDAEPNFAFNAKSWQKVIKTSNCFFLTQSHRQKDPRFAQLLNRLRFGVLTDDDKNILDRRYTTPKKIPTSCIELVTHRSIADRINQEFVDNVDSDIIVFRAVDRKLVEDNSAYRDATDEEMKAKYPSFNPDVHIRLRIKKPPGEEVIPGKKGFHAGEFERALKEMDRRQSEYSVKLAKVLYLKIGAPVMINQNIRDSETNEVKFYNGQQGEITAFAGSSVWVKFAGESEPREVNPITEVVYKIPQSSSAAYGRKMPIVSRQQLPLSISKAITIHKSQGQTLKVVKITMNEGWERGQAYVALSRATSLNGLYLTNKIKNFDPAILQPWGTVARFHAQFAQDDINKLLQPTEASSDSSAESKADDSAISFTPN